MNELEIAIKDLIITYEAACNQEWIRNPLGWALYKTWKKYDKRIGDDGKN